jgi:hypothetical protein
MRVREKQVHDRKTENHDNEIKNAQLGGARTAPTGIARQAKIEYVGYKYQ